MSPPASSGWNECTKNPRIVPHVASLEAARTAQRAIPTKKNTHTKNLANTRGSGIDPIPANGGSPKPKQSKTDAFHSGLENTLFLGFLPLYDRA